jgi:hypothetical protein
MNLTEYQRLQLNRFEPGAGVNSFGGILLSTLIVGFALIVIAIFASFSLCGKIRIK